MELTEAELAEGRRLLEESRKQQAIDRMGIAATVWNCWVSDHADALLARREEIAREAVREFAVQVGASVFESSGVDANATIIVLRLIKKLAAASGVALDEKP